MKNFPEYKKNTKNGGKNKITIWNEFLSL
jgi:hypothetical protein